MKFLVLFLLTFNVMANTQYGTAITLKKTISLSQAIKSNSKEEVLIEAKVGSVCKTKGCWMSLEDKSADYRVTFKDYKFFVPFSLVGKNVLVQGKIIKKKMSLAETKHYIEDAGGDPSKVTEGKTEYRLVASGVKVLK
ncbi:hypothetical protein A9Q84_06450 [Halobacteriovorax marinus]|uniref:DUF4920 domain-containing protein n=1 Tax=Halobacteriovorax marinus TaxID=97084 RepID=A0A1Y5FG59_9BACT|nr:hypothetical protein A9Q84_06450 [Halobacteriovorax marinus]